MLVVFVGPALASVGLEVMDVNAQWDAGTATIAIRAIREQAAATKPSGHQLRVDVVMDQMAGGGDL